MNRNPKLDRYFDSARQGPSLVSGKEARDLLSQKIEEPVRKPEPAGIGRGAKVGAATALLAGCFLVAGLLVGLPEARGPEAEPLAIAEVESGSAAEEIAEGMRPIIELDDPTTSSDASPSPVITTGPVRRQQGAIESIDVSPDDIEVIALADSEESSFGQVPNDAEPDTEPEVRNTPDDVVEEPLPWTYSRVTPTMSVSRGQQSDEVRVMRLPILNTPESHEYNPLVSPDGKTLYFTSSNVNGLGGHDIWTTSRVDGADDFSAPVNLGSRLNSSQNEGGMTLSGDGRTMFYTSCNRSDGLGDCDLYEARLSEDGWELVRNVREVNTPYWESHPSISSDGSVLYFLSTRPGTVGGGDDTDIWVSRRQEDGTWTRPENLGRTINTRRKEDSPYIAPGGDRLYFSSEGHGGLGRFDFFVSEQNEEGEWGRPQNLGPEINTEASERFLSLSVGEDVVYFARGDDHGDFNLWVAERKPVSETAIITGTIRSTERNDYIRADLLFVDRITGRILGQRSTVGGENRITLILSPEEYREGGRIDLYGIADKIGQFRGSLDLPSRDSYSEFRFDLQIDTSGSLGAGGDDGGSTATDEQSDRGIALALHQKMLLIQGGTLPPGPLRIIDSRGNVVLFREIAPGETGPEKAIALDVSDLSVGLYLVRAEGTSGLFRIEPPQQQ